MKTIKQIADEIGVSKQAVHKKIKQEPLKTELEEFTATVKNTLQIDVDGEKLIKSEFLKDKLTIVTHLVDENANQSTTELISSLQAQISFLQAQNEDLRKENSKLTEKVLEQSEKMLPLIEQAQKLAENAQTLHAMENVKPQLTDGKKKWQFWKK